MDYREEKEAFEKHASKFFTTNEAFENDGKNYVYDEVKFMWDCWLAAKSQAVPEGFVLVPKEPSADLVNHGHQVFLGHFNEGGQTGGRSLYFAYKAMIEAQEQSHDSKN